MTVPCFYDVSRSPVSYSPSHLGAHLALLERVPDSVILPDDDLPLLLSRLMLDPDLLCIFVIELANKPWIPQFARDAQIFTTSHKGVGFATLGCSGDTIRLEILLLTTRYRNQTVCNTSALCLIGRQYIECGA